MAEHKHGEMDTTAKEDTFNGFVTFATRSIIVIVVTLIFLALING